MRQFIEKLNEKLDMEITDTYYKSVEGNRYAGIENNAYHNIKRFVIKLTDEYNKKFEPTADLLEHGVESYNRHLEEQYRKGYEDAKNETKWIPCEEKMPEDTTLVLVCFEYYRYGEYNRMYRTIGTSYTWYGEWSGFVNGSSGWRDLKILAWQPLPELYEPEEKQTDFYTERFNRVI